MYEDFYFYLSEIETLKNEKIQASEDSDYSIMLIDPCLEYMFPPTLIDSDETEVVSYTRCNDGSSTRNGVDQPYDSSADLLADGTETEENCVDSEEVEPI